MQYLKFFISASLILIVLSASYGIYPSIQGNTQKMNTNSVWFEKGSMETYSITIDNCGKVYSGALSIKITDTYSNGTYSFTENSSTSLLVSDYPVPYFYNQTLCGPFQAVNSSILSDYSKENLSSKLYGLSIWNPLMGYNYGNVSEITSGYTYNNSMGSFTTDRVSANSTGRSIHSYFDQKSGIMVGFAFYLNLGNRGTLTAYSNLTQTNVNTTLIPAKPQNNTIYSDLEIISIIALSAATAVACIRFMRSEKGNKKS